MMKQTNVVVAMMGLKLDLNKNRPRALLFHWWLFLDFWAKKRLTFHHKTKRYILFIKIFLLKAVCK